MKCTIGCATADSQAKLLAAKALTNTLKGFDFDDIIRIDMQMRQTTSMEWSVNWREQKNDWVIQIREADSNAFDKRMQNLSKGEILTALPFAEKLKWSSRDSHGEYTQKFFDKLVSQEHKEDLARGLQSYIRLVKI